MAFNKNFIRRHAKVLRLTEAEMKDLVKRMLGHLQMHGLNEFELARSFFVLKEICTRKIQKELENNIPEFGFKQRGIILYRVEIVDLLNEGYGSQKIHNALSDKANCPSLATIKRYIKAYKEFKEEQSHG